MGKNGHSVAAKLNGGTAPADGTAVSVSIRLDRIGLTKVEARGKPKQSTVEGRVVTTEYQGSTVKATLDIAGKEKFVINLPDAGFFASGPSDGDTALASWDTADMHVL